MVVVGSFATALLAATATLAASAGQPSPSLVGLGRNATCHVRAGPKMPQGRLGDLKLSKQFEAATVADCCDACQAEAFCIAFTVGSRKAVHRDYARVRALYSFPALRG